MRKETQLVLSQLKEDLANVTRSAEAAALSPVSADSELRILLIRAATLRQTINTLETCP